MIEGVKKTTFFAQNLRHPTDRKTIYWGQLYIYLKSISVVSVFSAFSFYKSKFGFSYRLVTTRVNFVLFQYSLQNKDIGVKMYMYLHTEIFLALRVALEYYILETIEAQ